MLITSLEFTDRELFDGCKVRRIGSDKIRTIKFFPEEMTIFEAVQAGLFDPVTNVDFQTVFANRSRFELIG